MAQCAALVRAAHCVFIPTDYIEGQPMRISRFRQDDEKAVNGTWVQVGQGLELLLAMAGNTKHEELVRVLGKPHMRLLRSGTPDAVKKAAELNLEAMSQTVLLGWRNLQDDEGNEVPYSHEKALEYLQIPKFAEIVLRLSQDFANFRVEDKEDAKGN